MKRSSRVRLLPDEVGEGAATGTCRGQRKHTKYDEGHCVHADVFLIFKNKLAQFWVPTNFSYKWYKKRGGHKILGELVQKLYLNSRRVFYEKEIKYYTDNQGM